MQSATIFAGFGGQGVLFAGHVLAQAAVLEGRSVSWMPSYGPEMRGGTASCTVIVADRPIGSPIVDAAEVVVALNPPSLAKFEPILVPGGLLVVNASLIEAEPQRSDVEVAAMPCSAIARASGDDRLVSIVALGAVLARRPIVEWESVQRALVSLVGEHRPELIEANLTALQRGSEAGRVPADDITTAPGRPSSPQALRSARPPGLGTGALARSRRTPVRHTRPHGRSAGAS